MDERHSLGRVRWPDQNKEGEIFEEIPGSEVDQATRSKDIKKVTGRYCSMDFNKLSFNFKALICFWFISNFDHLAHKRFPSNKIKPIIKNSSR